jgi:hypothetical protein
MIRELLRHPDSTYNGIDPTQRKFWGDRYPNTAVGDQEWNKVLLLVSQLEEYTKATVHKDYSENVLRSWGTKPRFDFIYIDGDHSKKGVLFDFVNSWPLLRKDGIIIFDDMDKVASVVNWVRQIVDCNLIFSSNNQLGIRK